MNKYKYKEAFVILTDWFHSYVDHNGVKVQERHITEEYKEAKQTIQELVEKATPKKVIDKTITDYFDDDGGFCQTFEYKQTICPKCEGILIDEYEDIDLEGWDNCPRCGQSLLWSESEDEQ